MSRFIIRSFISLIHYFIKSYTIPMSVRQRYAIENVWSFLVCCFLEALEKQILYIKYGFAS